VVSRCRRVGARRVLVTRRQPIVARDHDRRAARPFDRAPAAIPRRVHIQLAIVLADRDLIAEEWAR
jgi:hypothetical protein